MTAGDVSLLVGACLLVWTLGWGGGLMVRLIRDATDQF
jgi:hypothetical protein